MQDKELEHPLIVDGVKRTAHIVARECTKCGEILIPGPEIERVTAEIRAGESYSGKFNLRLTPQLHRELAEMAREHGRSLNQEIVEILEETAKKKAMG